MSARIECCCGVAIEHPDVQVVIRLSKEHDVTCPKTASPDCVQGKHQACDGSGWNHIEDEPADCTCDCHGGA